MKTIEAQIPEQMDRAIEALISRGWFGSREEVVREAIRRFLDSHQPDLMERFVREDVEWGLRGRS